MEERVKKLENDFGTSMGQIARSLNELESEQYEQRSLLREHSRDLRELKLRTATIETRLGSVDARLNNMDEKIDAIQVQQRQMNDKLDTVIDLLMNKPQQ